jgi:hypothetical protein
MAQEGNRVTLPLQGKVADCLQGRGCINGGRVWDESCFFWQVRAEREGNNGVAGNIIASSSPVFCASTGGRRLTVPFKTAPFDSFFFFLFF